MKELTIEEKKMMIKGSNTGLVEGFHYAGGKGKKRKAPIKNPNYKDPRIHKVIKVKKPKTKAPSKNFAEEVKAAHTKKK